MLKVGGRHPLWCCAARHKRVEILAADPMGSTEACTAQDAVRNPTPNTVGMDAEHLRRLGDAHELSSAGRAVLMRNRLRKLRYRALNFFSNRPPNDGVEHLFEAHDDGPQCEVVVFLFESCSSIPYK
jgi:hypothetical protein